MFAHYVFLATDEDAFFAYLDHPILEHKRFWLGHLRPSPCPFDPLLTALEQVLTSVRDGRLELYLSGLDAFFFLNRTVRSASDAAHVRLERLYESAAVQSVSIRVERVSSVAPHGRFDSVAERLAESRGLPLGALVSLAGLDITDGVP